MNYVTLAAQVFVALIAGWYLIHHFSTQQSNAERIIHLLTAISLNIEPISHRQTDIQAMAHRSLTAHEASSAQLLAALETLNSQLRHIATTIDRSAPQPSPPDWLLALRK